jgi:hypothetical protein
MSDKSKIQEALANIGFITSDIEAILIAVGPYLQPDVCPRCGAQDVEHVCASKLEIISMMEEDSEEF